MEYVVDRKWKYNGKFLVPDYKYFLLYFKPYCGFFKLYLPIYYRTKEDILYYDKLIYATYSFLRDFKIKNWQSEIFWINKPNRSTLQLQIFTDV